MKVSERLIFPTLSTVLISIYVIYFYLYADDPGTGWYIVTAPIATFISSYFFSGNAYKDQSFFYIIKLSALLTVVSHSLNIVIMGTFAYLLEVAHGGKDPAVAIVFIPAGIFMSLLKGGPITFGLFLISGLISRPFTRQRLKNNLSQVYQLRFVKEIGPFLPGVILSLYFVAFSLLVIIC